jgi:hypothetical protein
MERRTWAIHYLHHGKLAPHELLVVGAVFSIPLVLSICIFATLSGWWVTQEPSFLPNLFTIENGLAAIKLLVGAIVVGLGMMGVGWLAYAATGMKVGVEWKRKEVQVFD